jgi:hypothetical protein
VARESEVSFGELLPRLRVYPGGQDPDEREQFPQSLCALLTWIKERRKGGKAVQQFPKPPCRSLAVLPPSLLKKPGTSDEAPAT